MGIVILYLQQRVDLFKPCPFSFFTLILAARPMRVFVIGRREPPCFRRSTIKLRIEMPHNLLRLSDHCHITTVIFDRRADGPTTPPHARSASKDFCGHENNTVCFQTSTHHQLPPPPRVLSLVCCLRRTILAIDLIIHERNKASSVYSNL
jgi:hypothetical protein